MHPHGNGRAGVGGLLDGRDLEVLTRDVCLDLLDDGLGNVVLIIVLFDQQTHNRE